MHQTWLRCESMNNEATHADLSILNARLIEPANADRTTSGDTTDTAIHISDGRIIALGAAPDGFQAERTIDAAGLITCPGLIDSYARLREPGFEKKADIRSETLAALNAGITTLICSPDTDPVIDEVATVELINRRSSDAGFARVLPLAAMTNGLDGAHLSELATLKDAGCIAASNADIPMANTLVIRRVMEYAKTFDIVLVFAPMDPWLRASGCAHEGAVSTRLGLPGIPVAAETVALSMLIELTRQTGARVHFSRVTSARGAELIAQAKSRGLPVTADTSIGHLFYTEANVAQFDSNYHSVAPFRSATDREGLRQAVLDGTLDAVCSDHAPHGADAKLAPFPSTEPGISAIDTLLPLLLQFGRECGLSFAQTLKPATSGPAAVFGLDLGSLKVGSAADIILLDPDAEFTVSRQSLNSRGKNSPCTGETLQGVVRHSIVDGRIHA